MVWLRPVRAAVCAGPFLHDSLDMRNPANRIGTGTGDNAPPARCPVLPPVSQHDCLCGLLPRVETRTRVVLVLHQLEDHKTSNTGRLALLCLPNSEIVFRGDPERAQRAYLARQALPAPDGR